MPRSGDFVKLSSSHFCPTSRSIFGDNSIKFAIAASLSRSLFPSISEIAMFAFHARLSHFATFLERYFCKDNCDQILSETTSASLIASSRSGRNGSTSSINEAFNNNSAATSFCSFSSPPMPLNPCLIFSIKRDTSNPSCFDLLISLASATTCDFPAETDFFFPPSAGAAAC